MLVTAELGIGLLDALARDAGGLEDAARIRLVVGEGAQQVLRRDVGVAHLGGELLGSVTDLEQVVADAHLRHAARDLGLTRDGSVDLRLYGGGVDPYALHDGADVALPRTEQGLEQVNRLNLAGVCVGGDAEGSLKGLLSRDRPLIESHGITSPWGPRRMPRPFRCIDTYCSPRDTRSYI